MKRVWFLFACLLYAVGAIGQTAAFNGFSVQGGVSASTSGLNSTNKVNGVVPHATITVFLTGTTTKASIFKDAGGTVLSNPFTSADLGSAAPGQWLFFAATGQGYDVVMSGGIAPLVYSQPVTLTDLESGGGGGGGGCSVNSPNDCVITDPTGDQIIAQPTETNFQVNFPSISSQANAFHLSYNTELGFDAEFNSTVLYSNIFPIDIESANGGLITSYTSGQHATFQWDANGNTIAGAGHTDVSTIFPEWAVPAPGTLQIPAAQGVVLESNSMAQAGPANAPGKQFPAPISTPDPIVIQGTLGMSQSTIGAYNASWTQTIDTTSKEPITFVFQGFSSSNSVCGPAPCTWMQVAFESPQPSDEVPPFFSDCNLSVTCTGISSTFVGPNFQAPVLVLTISGSTCNGGAGNGTWLAYHRTESFTAEEGAYDITIPGVALANANCTTTDHPVLTFTPVLGGYGEQVQFVDASTGAFSAKLIPADAPLNTGLTSAVAGTLPNNYTSSLQMWIGRADSDSANSVVIIPWPGDTINGLSSYTLPAQQYSTIHFVSDGKHNWFTEPSVVTATSPIVATYGAGVVNLSCPSCGSSSGGTSLTVNGGAALGSANLGNLPAAGANGILATWQISGSNVSAEIVGDGVSTHFLNGTGTFTTPSGSTFTPQVNGTNLATTTGINVINSTVNSTGLTLTASNPATTSVKYEITGNVNNANLATQTANTVLGALTATTPSGLAVPSCSGASNALTWTTGTGFGCNTISGGSTIFQVNGTGLASSTTINYQNSAATNGITLTFTNPSAGNVQLGFTGTLNNSGLTNPSMTVNGTTCTLGSSCSPSSSTAWSAITNPTGNLALTMGADTTTLTYGATTSTPDLFAIADTLNNTGTGIMVHFHTASGSTEIPWQADANGVGCQITATGVFACGLGSSQAGTIDLGQGTAPGAAPTSEIQIYAPASVTAYNLVLPGAVATAGNTFLSCTAASPSVCSWTAATGGGDTITSPNSTITVGGTSTATTLDVAGSAGKILAGATPALTFTPALGVDGTSAGTLQLANGSSAAHTIFGSAATTSNTILGFATAPTTGDLVDCATSSTTCTLTDSGVLAANVVTAASAATAAKQICTASGTSKTCSYIDFPSEYMVPSANCNNTTAGAGWSIGSGGTVTCRAGTNNLGGYIAITDTSSTFAQFFIKIPNDWDTATNPYIRFGLAYPGTDGASAHTIIPAFKVSCAKGDGSTTDDVTFNASHSSSTITLSSATANLFFTTSNVQMNSTDMTGCVAGSMMIVQVGRATDTATSAANFYSATITIPRLVTVQAN